MLGRKTYTREEFDHGQAAIKQQIAVYKKLARAIAGDKSDKKLESALAAFEGPFFNNMTLMLDRLYIHRIRPVTGKGTNPLNEVELICESLMNNDGVLDAGKVIKYVPEQSVLKLAVGDRISLTADDFERLAAAFFAELEAKFL